MRRRQAAERGVGPEELLHPQQGHFALAFQRIADQIQQGLAVEADVVVEFADVAVMLRVEVSQSLSHMMCSG